MIKEIMEIEREIESKQTHNEKVCEYLYITTEKLWNGHACIELRQKNSQIREGYDVIARRKVELPVICTVEEAKKLGFKVWGAALIREQFPSGDSRITEGEPEVQGELVLVGHVRTVVGDDSPLDYSTKYSVSLVWADTL